MATSDDDLKTLTEETLVQEKDAHVENPNSNGDGSNGVEGTLAEADELFQRGSKAIEEGDYNEAADCLSRALEIKWGFRVFNVHKVIAQLLLQLFSAGINLILVYLC